jgi:diguanylate cyclase (GGDEF)-like protein
MQFKLENKIEPLEISSSSSSILENTDSAIVIFDGQKNRLFFNSAAEKILGDHNHFALLEDWIYSLAENFVQEDLSFKANEIPWPINSVCPKELNDLEILVSKINVHADFWQNFDTQQFSTTDQCQIRSSSINKTIELELSKMPEKILNSSSYDQLTNLPNHNLLLEYINQLVVLATEQLNYIFAVLFIDINRFKVINSSLGRILGDQLLIAVSQRLKACLRSQDFIARLGNDEFVILLSNIENISYATNIAERIYRELTIPFNLEGYEVFVEASIGIALGSKDYTKPEDLLRDAELAVSDAKRQSKSHYQIFNQSMRGKALTLLQLENDLRWAIKREEFILYYQPIISLTDNRIKGFEVLLRWRHPSRGLVAPGEFISLAEETGLIVPLGFWVLKEACSQMVAWQMQFRSIDTWKVSVNISSKQLAQPNFVESVKHILQETKLNPHSLKLEITESSLVEDTNATIFILKELKALGIEFSLDDFGTGYSSLSYLHQFPFDTLKIDRSFVSSIENNSEKLGIIRAIVTLARNLGMDTIAEGIETVNQLAQLKALKCEYGQGYFLFKPLDKEILETIIMTEIASPIKLDLDGIQSILEEQIAREQLLFQIEHLRQELEEIKLEKADLEIILETTTEHADLVESQLRNEICDRQKAQAALHQANRVLEKLSVLDSLTQVANRRRFDNYLLQEWQKAKQLQAPISLILCDIDYFKLYNDTYGHPIGDYCLLQVALAIECAVESTSGLVARYGGEEFGIILPGMDGLKALQVAEEITIKVRQLHITHQKSPVDEYVTISLGVYSIVPNPKFSPELLINLADKALYQAKDRGRNQANLLTLAHDQILA